MGTVTNYAFAKLFTNSPRAFAVNSATCLNTGAPGSPQTVVLNVFKGHGLKKGKYLLGVISGGITDMAGNAMNGALVSGFPTGTGTSGTGFSAEFVNNGHDISTAVQTGQFVPVVSAQPGKAPTISYTTATSPTALPSGPLSQSGKKKGHHAKPAAVSAQSVTSPALHKLSIAHRARKAH